MDNRINILNRLKEKLNNYLSKENPRKEDWNEVDALVKEPLLNNTRIRAQMISENKKIGIVMHNGFLNNSNVFAESTKNGMIRYHIYPSMSFDDSQEGHNLKKEAIKYAHARA